MPTRRKETKKETMDRHYIQDLGSYRILGKDPEPR